MDLTKMIAELQAERDRLTNAILALERLAEGNQRKRGRPPKWLKDGPVNASADSGASAEQSEI
jgi:hypothetical protein